MTEREFLNSIISNSAVSADDKEYAKSRIAALDARNLKRANTKSKDQIANDAIKEGIYNYLAEVGGAVVASEIGAAVAQSTAKVSALCGQMVTDGRLAKSEVKIPKKGKIFAYSAIVADEDADAEDEAVTE